MISTQLSLQINMKNILLTIALLLTFGYTENISAQTDNSKQTKSKKNKKVKSKYEYLINDNKTSKEEFDALLKSLTEIEGTWYCKLTTDGGKTGFEAKDSNNIIYVYHSSTISDVTKSSLTVKKETKKIKSNSEYLIDDKETTKEEFDKLLKSLTEIKGTWYCELTTNGGNTGFHGKNAKGVIYEYNSYTESGETKNILTQKKEGK